MNVKEQITILVGLQDYDAQLLEKRKHLKELPLHLDEMRSDIQAVDAVVSQETEELTEQDRWRGEKEEEQQFLEAQVARVRQQMQGVRAHREALALQRQLDASRKQLAELEDEILQAMTALDERRAAVTEHQSELDKLKKQFATEELEIQAQIDALQAEIQEITQARDADAEQLDGAVRKRYLAIASRRYPSVVEALDGRCTGCNMALLPQLYNTLFYANSIEVCPQCNRMIYLREAVFGAEEEGEPSTGGGDGSDAPTP